MNRFRWLFASALVLIAAPAFAHTWTDNQGLTVEGEFVRVLKGKVVLSVAGRIVQVPFARLTDDDQEFVREQLEARGQGSFLAPRKTPAKKKPTDEKRDNDGKLKLGADRTWTDSGGHTVQARFVNVENLGVILQFSGKQKTVPFAKLSSADQQYVREEMTTRGQADRVPAMPQAMATVPRIAQAAPPQPRTVPPQATQFPQPKPIVAQTPPAPQIKFPELIRPAAPPPLPTFTRPPFANQPLPSPQAPAIPVAPPINYQVTQKFCSSCKQVVPDSCKAGDRCPHCGAYFDYEDSPTGRKAAPFSWTRIGTPTGIGSFVLFFIISVARRMWFKR